MADQQVNAVTGLETPEPEPPPPPADPPPEPPQPTPTAELDPNVDLSLSLSPRPRATGMCWSTRCEAPQAQAVSPGYPAPFRSCRVDPQFSADATTSQRSSGGHEGDKTADLCCYSRQGGCGSGQMGGGRAVRDAAGRAQGLAHAEASIWVAQSQAEYASITSFAVLSRELLALAAPPTLLRAALEAAADEARHAHSLGERAQLRAVPVVQRRPSWSRIAAESVADGCVGETFAALMAQLAAERCPDPARAAALRRIAADELRHAELAFRLVAVARSRGAGAEALKRGLAMGAGAKLADEALGYGLVDEAERLKVYAYVRNEIVRPILSGEPPPQLEPRV